MPYTHVTFSALKTQLANRLGDVSKIYWRDVELGLYVKESLRTWQAFSAFWRVRATFNTAAGTEFYDLPAQMSSVLGYNLKDQDIVKDLQYHLLENADTDPAGSSWVGTEMFVLADLTAAIERRRNQFLAETGIVVTRSTPNMPPPPVSRVPLADTTIDVRRVVWKRNDGTFSNCWRSDEWELSAGALHWEVNPAVPYAYSILATPPLTLQVAPAPLDAATLDLLTVDTPAALDPTTGVLLNIPDNFAWVIKWGALADLLGKDGQARDPQRAAFCEQRYQLGVNLARQSAVIILCEIQGDTVLTEALEAIDAERPGWQGSATATPTDICIAGWNLIALRPVPDGIYSVTMDVAQNAPVPSADVDQVQLGREQLDAVLDYAEHLAAFKMGGAEFDATLRQAENFMRQATTYNERLAASALFSVPATGQSRLEEDWRIRRRKATVPV